MPIISTGGALRSHAWPFQSGEGAFPRPISDADVAATDLRRLLNTEPGEDKTEPEFGVRLRKLLFRIPELIVIQADSEVRQAIDAWLKSVVVLELSFGVVKEGSVTGVDGYLDWSYGGQKQPTIDFSRKQ